MTKEVTPKKFNEAIAKLERIHNIIIQCHERRWATDLPGWEERLRSYWSELYEFMDNNQRRKMGKMFINLEKTKAEFNRARIGYEYSGQMVGTTYPTELHNIELELNNLKRQCGLSIPEGMSFEKMLDELDGD